MLGVQKGVIFNTLDEIQGTLGYKKRKQAIKTTFWIMFSRKTTNYKALKFITKITDKKTHFLPKAKFEKIP